MSEPTELAPTTVIRVMAQNGRVIHTRELLPELGPGDIQVRSAYAVISPGTERSIINATKESPEAAHEYPHPLYEWPVIRSQGVDGQRRRPRFPPPEAASLGYSLAGIVERVGADVVDVKPGDRVACSGSQCAYHADRVVVPRNLTAAVPEGVDLPEAAHVTLGAIAIEALRSTRCVFGETVVIIGTGMLGLLLTQLARHAGMRPIALDANPHRLKLAAEFGAVLGVASADDQAVADIRAATDGFGADAVIIAAADPDSILINFSFDVLRAAGRVVALGDFGMNINRAKFFRAQAVLVPSVAYGPGRYDPVYEENNVDLPIGVVRWTENRNMQYFLRLLADKQIRLDGYSVARVQFEDAPQAYDELMSADPPITGVLKFPDTLPTQG